FVIGRSSDVVNGLGFSSRYFSRLLDCGIVQRLAGEECLGFLSLQRVETDVRQTDPCLLADSGAVHDELNRDAGCRVVSDLPLELQICASARWRRNRNPNLLE